MKRETIVFGLVLGLAMGCRKDHKKSPLEAWDGKNHITGDCSYAPAFSSGSVTQGVCLQQGNCANHYQDVTTLTDVISHPLDSIAVSLCVGSDCIGMPSAHIVLGHHVVSLVNAFEAGYTVYNINEAICRNGE